ncbi:regulator of telomere elongation helicase 1-like [Amphiura filiformis]|uniref:regulator of telomere elongation helicase 1-like n=1 Tax=Amphiura filiformis TaxID=82378 RepID=UPI003B22187F
MASFKCRGVNIEFPFEPYECQKNYMSKVIECLQTSQNAILESPTGTGKTVSLLCSTLAWRRAYIATQELGKCIRDDGGSNNPGGEGSNFRQELSKELKEGATGSGWGEVQEGNFVDRPRIIYASRTHSQLSQAVDQLKDTAYRPRMSIIGSREQLCIHPEVLQQDSNAGKVHMCRAKVDNRMCHFHNNLEHKKGEKAFSEGLLDIEDLVKLGNQHKVCPYYMARELKTSADIVFMPYNYLLDSKARRIHGVELSGNVVIFDEAHNVERICEESASFEFSSADLASCISETDQLLKRTVEVEELNKDFRDDNAAEGDFVAKELCEMKMIFMELENLLSAVDIPASGSGVTKPGGYIFELFAKAKVTYDKRTDIMSIVEKMISHLTSSSTGYQNKAAGLQKFLDVMNIVFSRDTPAMSGHNQTYQMSSCYKVHIRGEDGFSKKKKQRTDLWTSAKQPSQKKVFVLSYWCFSPGFSMQELVSQGVRSIILTSGTLAPLSSFKSELRIDFPIQLENPHVIEQHQMHVGIVTRGPDKTVLNSSYQTRFNKDYILSLGNTIVNFARIVPNGLLVFFPSYPVMNHCLEIWQEDGISNRITQYKQMFVEPKGKGDFVEAMEGFYEKVRDPTLNGASFFAVCRGKVSEGLDFADINGRAVVITGLPFPPRMDPRVNLKMQYLDEMRRKNNKFLSGQEWYRQQASRAVNQAIGRVIRHKEDYGAILLCDTRFTSKDSRAQLPLWLRPYVNEYTQFGHAVRDLTIFFKVAEKKMPAPKAKKARSTTPIMYETETSGMHMPGPSNRLPAMKARELDSHVRSLKRNRDGSHVSEDQLKSMYEEARPKTSIKSTGLLDALSHAEGTRSTGSGFLFDDALREQTNLRGNTDEPRKKKRIVIKERGFDSAGTSSDVNIPAKKKPTGDTMLSAPVYLQEVKKSMSNESYENFSSLIRNYKKTCDLNELVSKLADLFVDEPSKHYLFRNFYLFVRPAHKKEFDSVCQCVIGKGCGFKPEDAIPRKKLERHKESTSVNSDKVKGSVVTSKTEDSEKAKSTATASITSLNTDSHLNQGQLQTTHNASEMASSEQGANSHLNQGHVQTTHNASEVVTSEQNSDSHLNQRHPQTTHNASDVTSEQGNNQLEDNEDMVNEVCTDENDCNITVDNIEMDTIQGVGDTRNDGPVSHSALVAASEKLTRCRTANENTDRKCDDKQSIVGLHHNTTVQFEDSKQSSHIDMKRMQLKGIREKRVFMSVTCLKVIIRTKHKTVQK